MFVDDDVLCDDRGAVSPSALGLAPPDPPLFALLPAPSSLTAEVFQVARASHLEVRDLVGHDPQGALVNPAQDLRDRRLGDPEVVRDRLLPPAFLGQGDDLLLAAPNHAPRLGATLPPTGGPARWARRFVRAVTHRILRSPAAGRVGRARWPVNASHRVRVTWMYCGSRSMATHVRSVFSAAITAVPLPQNGS